MSHRTRIKICGITNREDALAAIEYGADALGFIFVPDTPRYVGANPEIDSILRSLPPFVSPVAVCADWSHAAHLRDTPVDTIQYYGEPSEPVAAPAGVDARQWAVGSKRRLRAFRIRDEASLDEIEREIAHFRPHALLLDAYHPGRLGGAGTTFNWELAVAAKQRFDLPIVLAGGLSAANVGEAIRAVRPYAVDVSSGVEAAPGRKDHARLRAFIHAVREADPGP